MRNPKTNFIQSSIVLAALCLGLAACAGEVRRDQSEAPQKGPAYAADNRVELYGRHRCPICRDFVARLEQRNIKYSFYEIDSEPERAREMWELIRENFPDIESVGLPVVRVNDTVLLRPDFASFESHLKAAR